MLAGQELLVHLAGGIALEQTLAQPQVLGGKVLDHVQRLLESHLVPVVVVRVLEPLAVGLSALEATFFDQEVEVLLGSGTLPVCVCDA